MNIENSNYNQIRDYLNYHPAKRDKLVNLVSFKKGIAEQGRGKTSFGVYIFLLPDYLESFEFLNTVPETPTLVETLRVSLRPASMSTIYGNLLAKVILLIFSTTSLKEVSDKVGNHIPLATPDADRYCATNGFFMKAVHL